MLVLLTACSAKPEFQMTEGRELLYTRDDHYGKNVSMLYYESDDFDFGIQEGLTMDADETAQQIYDDLNLLFTSLGIKEKAHIEICFVEELTQGIVIPGVDVSQDNVFANMESYLDGSYRLGLVQAALSLSEPWQIYGLYDLLYGDIDETVMLEYLKAGDLRLLDLFGSFFYDEWMEPKDLGIVHAIAASFSEYIFDDYDLEVFLSNPGAAYKHEWLTKLGVDPNYINTYDQSLRLSFSINAEYPLIVKSDQSDFYFKKVMFLETGFDVQKFIYENETGREYIIDYIKSNVSIQQVHNQINESPLQFYFYDTPGISSTNGNVIQMLRNVSVHLHEASHAIFFGKISWYSEGLCDYFGFIIAENTVYKESMLTRMKGLYTISNDDIPEVVYNYVNNGGSLESLGTFDVRLFYDTIAYADYNMNFEDLTTIADYYSYIETDDPNHYLTYEQAASLIAYLVDEYSLDDVFLFYLQDGDYSIFGRSPEEIQSDWISYLESNYQF